jgi:hypothetical protein
VISNASPKFKDEHMFQSSWSPEDEQAVKKIAKKLGFDLDANEIAGSRATFASIEDVASKVGRAVARHLMADLAIKQTELLDQPQPCPTCQRLCDVQVRDRPLTTGEGPIDLRETVCRCSGCRRDFFPSTGPVETPPTWL